MYVTMGDIPGIQVYLSVVSCMADMPSPILCGPHHHTVRTFVSPNMFPVGRPLS